VASFLIQTSKRKVIGTTSGDNQGNFKSIAKCPVCNKDFHAKKKKDQKGKSIVEMESSVKLSVKNHLKNKHGDA